jgi:branched-chain amino acid transport system substrate-binding protein
MKTKFGSDLTGLSELDAATYDGIMLWSEGVKKAGSLDREKVLNALETGVSYEGPSGKVVLDPATHHTIRTTFLGRGMNRQWEIMATFPNQLPSDTGGQCDLVKDPKMNKQFTPTL